MPCQPTWTHVIYWYAKPGIAGPAGHRSRRHSPRGPRRFARTCSSRSRAKLSASQPAAAPLQRALGQLLRCGASRLEGHTTGARLEVSFTILKAGRYASLLNLCWIFRISAVSSSRRTARPARSAPSTGIRVTRLDAAASQRFSILIEPRTPSRFPRPRCRSSRPARARLGLSTSSGTRHHRRSVSDLRCLY